MWVVPLKDKKGIKTADSFEKSLDESGRIPNKTCVDKDTKFYNRSLRSWLEKNYIEIYSTYNEGKSIVVERFIRPLNVYIHKFGDIFKKCNNKYHSAIKMKAVDAISKTCINFNKENNYKDPKFKVGNYSW